jgi:23S rRNA pseudouridine2605 synthase
MQGRISVNGVVVRELGTKVFPDDVITLDGKPLKPLTHKVYIMLNKPRGFVTTVSDEFGRATVMDLVPCYERLFPVGRLDADSEGLLLLTNDGDLTNRLTHPRYGFEKEYQALIDRDLSDAEAQRLRDGVVLDGRKTAPAIVERLYRAPQGVWFRIAIHEGRNRQIRRMLFVVNREVYRLVRVRVGPVRLGDLPSGHFRHLSPDEISALSRGPRSS